MEFTVYSEIMGRYDLGGLERVLLCAERMELNNEYMLAFETGTVRKIEQGVHSNKTYTISNAHSS